MSDGEFSLRRTFGFSLRVAWQVLLTNCCSFFFFFFCQRTSANREQNNWPLKDGSGESEGTTLFQTETLYNPTGDSKKQQHFPLMETRWDRVTAGPTEPAQPRLQTTITGEFVLVSEMWFLFCTPLLTSKQSPLITDQYCPHVHVVEHYHLHMYHFRVFNLMLRFRFLYFYWRKHLTLVSIYLDWARESLDFCGWEAQPLCASRCFQMLSSSSSSFRYGSDAFADKCDDKMDAAV